MKNEKLLTITLALNAILSTYANSANNQSLTMNYNNIYNKFVSNINSGKSNGENYKLIENILNKRNRELKDLYAQGDYIVKPEYLEWQIFATGFYAERGNGDNTRGNARYNSKTEGYFDENGRYVSTSGKAYKDKQEVKTIDLGVSIPLKEINREDLDIKIDTVVTKPTIPAVNGMADISSLSIPVLELLGFNLVKPEIDPIVPTAVSITIPSLAAYTNGASDTLLGRNINIVAGTHNLSDGSSRPSNAPENITQDHAIMEYNIPGSFSSSTDAIMNINVAKRAAITIDGEVGGTTNGVTFTNNGTINLMSENTVGLEIQTNPENTVFTIINAGTINGTGEKQVGMLFTVEQSNTPSTHSFENKGLIKLDGAQSVGIALPGKAGESYILTASNTSKIELNGEKSYGIAVPKNSDLANGSSIVNDINGEILVNGNKSGGIVTQSKTSGIDVSNKGTITIKAEDSFGIYTDSLDSQILNDGTIDISNSKKSIAMRNEGGSLSNNGNIKIEGGEQNIGMYSSSGIVDNFGNITINNGIDNIGVMIKDSGSSGINSGKILIIGEGARGVLVEDGGHFVNAGELSIEGKNIYGAVIRGGLAQLNGIKINADGANSVGLYAGGKNIDSTIDAAASDVTVNNGGINFTSEEKGEIILQANSKFSVGQKSLGFYTKDGGKISISDTIGTIKGGTSSENRGTAFYLTGKGTDYYPVTTMADIENLLSDSGIEINSLELNMESGSRLFSLENVALNLNTLKDIDTSGFSNVRINGNDYIKMLLNKGLLNIDELADLDDASSNYSRVEIVNSSMTNNSVIKGTGNSKQGMAQANGVGLAKSTVTLTNNGEINLKGQESVGIYTDRGIINNNGTIDTQGDKSFGIYGVNGTEVTTTAGSTIKAGSNGAGIVLQSYAFDSSGTAINTSGNDGTFKLDHNGELTVLGENSFGIYADNNDTSSSNTITTRIVNLNAGSMIDVSGTTSKGTGLYANRSTVNTAGDMKVGTDGIGVYAKDSNVNLTGGTMDILGSGSTGIFLNGSSNLTATNGTINVKGDNTTVFYIDSLSTTTGVENIQINVDPNLKMTLANVKNGNFIYKGRLDGAGKDSVLIAGENSAIGLDTNGIMSSTYENVTGLVAKGGSAVNKGKLNLTGSNSIGLYTENANATNEGDLILGLNGVGIYNENGIVNNASGKIETGSNVIGIFGENSISINNNTLISSIGDSSIGIYSEGDITGTTIKNDISGLIDLSGSNVIGIYATGAKAKNITNDGEIKIGDSSDINKPSIGIYNNILGSIIQNNGTITLGKNSLGIYVKDGSVTENGILNVGEKGTGILSENGTVNITSNSVMNIAGNETVGVYGKNNASITNASSNILIGNGSYGFVLETGSSLSNTGSVNLGDNSVFVYGKGAGTITSSNTAVLTAAGSDNIMFYTTDGGIVQNKSSITADTGTGNIGIYNRGGSIENEGNISLGDSVLVYKDGMVDPSLSRYSVGVYGESSTVLNKGDISLGANGVGIYVKDNGVMAKNYGKITAGSLSSPKAGAMGIFADGGTGVENFGDITLFGDKSIGIAGRNAGSIINHGTLNITGADSIGIYGTLNTTVTNTGTINISGTDSVGIVAPSGKIINEGTIHYTNGATASKEQNGSPLPELINMGIIKVDGHFSNEGMDISFKPDLNTLEPSTTPGVDFTMNSGTISANGMTITDTLKILPDFSQGTNAQVYKLENALMTNNGQIISSNGKIPVVSKSLTWEATPKVNDEGNVDIYMHKLAYEKFTDGLWYGDFGKALDEKYVGSTGEAGSIFDKIDLIEEESDFRHVMASLAGNVYSNMNQRQEDIARAFDSSLSLMENSKNNTKENVKVNIIGGKGRTKEDTDGVENYDYTTTGVLALREVERSYRHMFGYSLGYLHTGFEFKDGNESEEWVDTLQLGLHSKYDVNNWVLKNNITGRISLHNIDRNIDWPSPTGRSELNGSYETYSISSDNKLGRELSLGKNGSITPYGGIKATYMTRPTFSEKGLESLEIEGNDAWSVKPRAGIELKGAVPLGSSTAWQLKGALDISYEYELANLNERERARLTKIEDKYHNLSKPEKEKGTLRTKAEAGVEIEDRYGIFLTGEYGVGNGDRDDYRAGVTLKAVF